jgi:thiol-disulfide isomerase/thioredoxin
VMRRLIVGTCLLALVAVVARADDTKQQKPSQMWMELVQKWRAAKQADKNEILADYAKKFVAYAKEHSKKAEGAEALGYVLQIPQAGGKDSPRSQALAMLKEDYVKSTAIKPILGNLANAGDDGMKIVKSVEAENPDKATRAFAVKALIAHKDRLLATPRYLRDNPEARTQFEQAQGKAAVQKLMDSIEPGEKEIKGYLTKLRGELKGHVLDLYEGAQAPEIVSQDIDGKKVKLSDLKGKVVVLDVWATWCPPCRAMIPHEREMVSKLKDKPFVLVSISGDAQKQTLVDFLKKEEMPWTHWWNGASGGILKDWEINSFPTIYVLDSKGVIRYRNVRNKAMEKAVETLLKEMEDKTKGKGS